MGAPARKRRRPPVWWWIRVYKQTLGFIHTTIRRSKKRDLRTKRTAITGVVHVGCKSCCCCSGGAPVGGIADPNRKRR